MKRFTFNITRSLLIHLLTLYIICGLTWSECDISNCTAPNCFTSLSGQRREIGISPIFTCSTERECGYNSTSIETVDIQQYPFTILAGTNISFLINTIGLRNASTTTISLVNNYTGFSKCSQVESDRISTSLYPYPLLLPTSITTKQGIYYLIFSAGFLIDCKFGARLKLTVESHNCGNDDDVNLCGGKGICTLKNNYTCECCDGYYEDFCEEYNGCMSNPCLNNGTCVDVIKGQNSSDYNCNCSIYFTGNQCETPLDYCSDMSCFNNGSCVNDYVNRTHKCNCKLGFNGSLCEYNINDCISQPCQNNGTCHDGVDSYTCQCLDTWRGDHCTIDVDECNITSPCLNNGTCQNLIGGYTCNCAPEFTGTNCEVDMVNDCDTKPCHNNATCIDLFKDFNCTCPIGFEGKTCLLDVNECLANICSSEGTISCTNTVGSYLCNCIAGYTGDRCEEEINECASMPCLNGGLCVNSINSYTCICQSDYLGSNCQQVANKCIFNPCVNNGTCRRSGEFLLDYTCECKQGWTGKDCSLDYNDCLSTPCQNGGVCTDGFNMFNCTCPIGWEGITCQINTNMCFSNPCVNNSTCKDGINGFDYTCSCQPGFTGKNCSENINDCLDVNCHNGTCIDLVLGHRCSCFTGYFGKNCETDRDVCSLNPCENGACENVKSDNGYICTCNSGWEGINCSVNIDDCQSFICQNGGTCHDFVNFYNCTCAPGFEGSNCESDINECLSMPCLNNATCVDLINNYKCLCADGYEGIHCLENVDECKTSPCMNNATCIDGINAFSCNCSAGYLGDVCQQHLCDYSPCANNGTCIIEHDGYKCNCIDDFNGENCTEKIDNCISNSCLNNATCIDGINSFTCLCTDGYTGINCEIDLCDALQCQNNGTCYTNSTGAFCDCQPDFIGNHCQTDTDSCRSSPCQNGGSCIRIQGNDPSYNCLCKNGFSGKNCENHLCNLTNPCENNGRCVQHERDVYECKCASGFQGKNCSLDVDECVFIPCKNSGTCQNYFGNFTCDCISNYTGRYCETELTYCEPNPCLNNGSCRNDFAGKQFRCDCQLPYHGIRCKDHVCDVDNPCQNGGTCLRTEQGATCQCPSGYTGTNCSFEIFECSSMPCLNNGTCIEKVSGYQCVCNDGFTGINCESSFSYCSNNPCRNFGTCIDDFQNGMYRCICPSYVTGKNCEVLNEPCLTNPCGGRGNCTNLNLESFKCDCFFGYDGPTCNEIVCPCQNDGRCVKQGDVLKCVCPVGYYGDKCESFYGDCRNSTVSDLLCRGGACIFTSYGYVCKCPLFLHGKQCEIFGGCSKSPCYNGTCVEIGTFPNFNCDCDPGWTGQFCNVDINECIPSPCLNGGTCLEENLNSYSCICTLGYSGKHCENSIELSTNRIAPVTSHLNNFNSVIHLSVPQLQSSISMSIESSLEESFTAPLQSSFYTQAKPTITPGTSSASQHTQKSSSNHISLATAGYISNAHSLSLDASSMQIKSSLLELFTRTPNYDHTSNANTYYLSTASNTSKQTLSTVVVSTQQNDISNKYTTTTLEPSNVNMASVSMGAFTVPPTFVTVSINSFAKSSTIHPTTFKHTSLIYSEFPVSSSRDKISIEIAGSVSSTGISTLTESSYVDPLSTIRYTSSSSDQWKTSTKSISADSSSMESESMSLRIKHSTSDNSAVIYSYQSSISSQGKTFSTDVISPSTAVRITTVHLSHVDHSTVEYHSSQSQYPFISSDGNTILDHTQLESFSVTSRNGIVEFTSVSSQSLTIYSSTVDISLESSIASSVVLPNSVEESLTNAKFSSNNSISHKIITSSLRLTSIISPIIPSESITDKNSFSIPVTHSSLTLLSTSVVPLVSPTSIQDISFKSDNIPSNYSPLISSITVSKPNLISASISSPLLKTPMHTKKSSYNESQTSSSFHLLSSIDMNTISTPLSIHQSTVKPSFVSEYESSINVTPTLSSEQHVSDFTSDVSLYSAPDSGNSKHPPSDTAHYTAIATETSQISNSVTHIETTISVNPSPMPSFLASIYNTEENENFVSSPSEAISTSDLDMFRSSDVFVSAYTTTIDMSGETIPSEVPITMFVSASFHSLLHTLALHETASHQSGTLHLSYSTIHSQFMHTDQLLSTPIILHSVSHSTDSDIVLSSSIAPSPPVTSIIDYSSILNQICNSNPCLNFGTCIQSKANFTCVCSFGFDGPLCENYNCNCSNNGRCVKTSPNLYECVCDVGFTGDNCEVSVGDCRNLNCSNHGQCTQRLQGFVCDCEKGYAGPYCNTTIENCVPLPCENGGICLSNSDGGYQCACPQGFQGKACEFDYNECAIKPCLNNGECREETVNNFTCYCQEGSYGSLCENELDYNSSLSTAMKSHGKSAEASFSIAKTISVISSLPSNSQLSYVPTCSDSASVGLHSVSALTTTNVIPMSSYASNAESLATSIHTTFVSSNLTIQSFSPSKPDTIGKSLHTMHSSSPSSVSLEMVHSTSSTYLSYLEKTSLLKTDFTSSVQQLSINASKAVISSINSKVNITVTTNTSTGVLSPYYYTTSISDLSQNTSSKYLLYSKFLSSQSEVAPILSTNQTLINPSQIVTPSLEEIPSSSVTHSYLTLASKAISYLPIYSQMTMNSNFLSKSFPFPSTIQLISGTASQVRFSTTTSYSAKPISSERSSGVAISTTGIDVDHTINASTAISVKTSNSLDSKTFSSHKSSIGYDSSFGTRSSTPHLDYFTASSISSLLPSEMDFTRTPIAASKSIIGISSSGSSSSVIVPPTPIPKHNLTCSDSPCNGYECLEEVSKNLNYKCICPHPTLLPQCKQGKVIHFPRFNGNSFIVHNNVSFDDVINQIVLTFRTASPNGLLLYGGNNLYKDFIMLVVNNGFLEFRCSTGAETSILRNDARVDTGNLVFVVARHDRRTGTSQLTVDKWTNSSTPLSQQLKSIEITTPWYVGGLGSFSQILPNQDIIDSTNFTGCIKDFEINDKPYHLSDANDWLNIGECDIDACKRGACLNNGICLQGDDPEDYTCNCTSGYHGDSCELRKEHCSGDPCNGGVCAWSETGHVCLCQYGRHGVDCSQELNISVPTFSSLANYSSYLEYPWQQTLYSASERFEVRLQFKVQATENDIDQNYLLVYGGQSKFGTKYDDFFALGLIRNHTVLVFNLGGGVGVLKSKYPIAINRTWHSVSVGRMHQYGFMHTDDQEIVRAESPGVLVGLDTYTPLYVGGVPEFKQLPNHVYVYFYHGFSGSIYDVSIRTTQLEFQRLSTQTYSDDVSKDIFVGKGLNIGDDSVDECQTQPCANNGTCTSQGATFVCHCTRGWKGILCQDRIMPCIEYNPCRAGSICREAIVGVECDCQLGWAGKYCSEKITIDVPYFHKSSYIGLSSLKNPIRFQTEIKIEFKPLTGNGLLFYVAYNADANKGDFFAVSLWNSYVYVRYFLGTRLSSMRTHSKIKYGKWHTINIDRRYKDTVMQLDNGPFIGVRGSGASSALDVKSLFYIGGLPQLSQVDPRSLRDVRSQIDFNGCVRLVQINGVRYSLNETTSAIGRNVLHCQEECMNGYCQHGGKCQTFSSSSEVKCNCLLGWTGNKCQLGLDNSTEIQLTGNGYLYFQDDDKSPQSATNIEISFNTTKDGLLLWAGHILTVQSDYCSIGISDGRPLVTFKVGSQTDEAHLTNKVNNGKEHTLRILRAGRNVYIFLDGSMPHALSLNAADPNLDINGDVYIGGLPDDVWRATNGKYRNGFNGCINKIKLKGTSQYLNIYDKQLSGLNIDRC